MTNPPSISSPASPTTPAHSRFDHWLFNEFALPAPSLGIYRILFSTLILLLAFPRDLWISNFSNHFYNPPLSLLYFVPGFPPSAFFYALNFLGIASALFLLVGRFTRTAGLTLAATLFLSNSFSYSFGKINHDIFILLVPLIMSFSSWGQTFSLDVLQPKTQGTNPPQFPNAPLALLAALLGCAMMFAALEKIRGGWLDPHRHATCFYLLLNYHQFGLQNPLNSFLLHSTSTPLSLALWKIPDYATVALEASFLLAALRLRNFRTLLALACFFHFAIALTLEISFWYSLITYAAFVDWSSLANSALLKKFHSRLSPITLRLQTPHLLLLSATIFLLYTRNLSLLALGRRFTQEPSLLPSITLWFVALIIGSRFLLSLRQRPHKH